MVSVHPLHVNEFLLKVGETMKKPVLAVSLLTLSLAISGCGGNATPTDSGPFVIAQSQEPTTLDPHAREDGGERIVNGNVYETLLAMDNDGGLTPLLAAELPTRIDAKTWEIKLRTGIKFHDDTELDAADVVASFERIIDPQFASEQSAFEGITSIKAIDAQTVRFETKGPDPVFPRRLYWIKIVPSEYADSTSIASTPIGTGPYKFVDWARGQNIKLEINEGYWSDAGEIRDVEFRFVPEGASRAAGIMNGEFDLSTNLTPEDIESMPNFSHIPGLEQTLMILDNDAGPTKDEDVRRALNYAVDKEALVESLYQGYAAVQTCQILGESTVGHNPNLEAYPYQPEKAKELIERAGVDGEEISVVGTAGRWLKDRELTEAVAQYWEEAGMKTNVQILDFDSYLGQLFNENRPNSIFLSETSELLDASQTMGSYYAMNAEGSSNNDKKLQELIDAAAIEVDADRRQELYNEATKHSCDSGLFTYLITIEDIYGLSERVTTWEPRVDAQIFVKNIALS